MLGEFSGRWAAEIWEVQLAILSKGDPGRLVRRKDRGRGTPAGEGHRVNVQNAETRESENSVDPEETPRTAGLRGPNCSHGPEGLPKRNWKGYSLFFRRLQSDTNYSLSK